MSVVCAIKEHGKVIIGADSQVTKGGTRTSLSNPNNYKIWQYDDVPGCYFAQVGHVREGQVIRVSDDLIKDLDFIYDMIDFKFCVKHLVPRMINELVENKLMKEEDTMSDSSFIFAYKNLLFVIDTDFTVIEVDDFCAIGSGRNEAIGSLLSTIGENAETRIIKAIKASAANDIYVDYPIIMVDTKLDKFKVIKENDLKDGVDSNTTDDNESKKKRGK